MPLSTGIDAVLPAGGRIYGSFATDAGTDIKALIELGGHTILARAIEALRSTPAIRHIVVAGPDEVAEAAAEADGTVPDGGSGPENIFRALERLGELGGGRLPDRALIMTTDLPFVTPDHLTGFIDTCPDDAGLCVPAIERREFERRFPDFTQTYVRLHDGEWMIGCTVLADPAALLANRQRIRRVFAARKSDIALGAVLGPLFVLRFLLGRLTIPQIQRRCSHLLGCSAKPAYGCAPELGFDIDKECEFAYAAEKLGAR